MAPGCRGGVAEWDEWQPRALMGGPMALILTPPHLAEWWRSGGGVAEPGPQSQYVAKPQATGFRFSALTEPDHERMMDGACHRSSAKNGVSNRLDGGLR
jgi:hypothetical protein